MLSFLSIRKISMALCASTEKDLQRFPISFANPIFSACQLLSMYLIISAVSRSVRIDGISQLRVESRKRISARAIQFTHNGLCRGT